MQTKFTYKGYTYVIEKYVDKSFNLCLIPQIEKYDRYSVKILVKTTIEEKGIFFNKKKEIETVVYESYSHMKPESAEMVAMAVIDILNCKNVQSINHLLRSEWGYKTYNDFLDWRSGYPEFYDETFEPFYTPYKKIHHF